MEVLLQAKDSAAWMAQRAGRFTSSVIGTLMQKPRMTKDMIAMEAEGSEFFGEGAQTLIAEKALEKVTGQVFTAPSTWAMKRGTALEAAARYIVSEASGMSLGLGSWQGMGADTGGTPDAFTADGDTVDIKCPAAPIDIVRFGTEVHDGDFASLLLWDRGYAWQTAHQAWVSGSKRFHLLYFTDMLATATLSDSARAAAQDLVTLACPEGFTYTLASDGFTYVVRSFALTPELAGAMERRIAAAAVERDRLAEQFRAVLAENGNPA